ncbi:MAG: RNA-binding S4 domain-containing protein [Lysobacterales bacterium]
MSSSVRLDKWLWAARFFKTRSVAREAVSGGKVHLNGNRAKPGRSINVGDELRIQRGEEEYIITRLEASMRRGPATVARTLYEESDESREQRERLAEQRKLEHQSSLTRERRPDKRQRRRIVRFKSGLDG